METKDLQFLVDQLQSQKEVEFTFTRFTEANLVVLNAILVKALAMRDSLYVLNSMITIVRELVENAQKANAKRMLFRKLGKNIRNPDEYAQLMREYEWKMKDILRNFESELEGGDLYISVIVRLENGNLIVEVRNNIELLDDEKNRIHLRLELGHQSAHFLDIYSKIQDSREGGGIGLVLIIFILKNMGVDPSALQLIARDGWTCFQLRIPAHFKPIEITTEIKRRILYDVKGIPTFPETIEKLLALCDNEEATIEMIADEIEKDPAITTDVVRLSNSAGFITGKRIYNVAEAIKTIGLKNVRALILVSGARKIIDSRYKKFEEIWEHCNKVSYYCRHLAHDYHLLSRFENIAIAGLLHDLGMIVLQSVDIDLVKRIATLTRDKKLIHSPILEEESLGISHSALGGHIACRWNFPDYLIEAIQFHHSPLDASEEFKDIVYAVYLANMLVGIEEKKYEYYFIENQVLKRFDLSGGQKIHEYHRKLKKALKAEEK
ncbi:MAG: HDOD domain-containing protein [Spirochaetes bacterium]|nr:HDOD domain-containing protein [Spirochaetota bacterium]